MCLCQMCLYIVRIATNTHILLLVYNKFSPNRPVTLLNPFQSDRYNAYSVKNKLVVRGEVTSSTSDRKVNSFTSGCRGSHPNFLSLSDKINVCLKNGFILMKLI